MRAGQKYFWPALFALERGRRRINVDYRSAKHFSTSMAFIHPSKSDIVPK